MKITSDTDASTTIPGESVSTHGAALASLSRKRRKRRKKQRVLTKLTLAAGILLAAATVYGIVVFIRLGQAGIHLTSARDASQRAATLLQENDIRKARLELKKSTDEFVRARNLLSSLEIKVLRKVPVVGSNVKVATALAVAGTKVSDAGAVVLDQAQVLEDERGHLRFPIENGRVDVDKLEVLQEPVARATSAVAEGVYAVEQSPRSMLIGTVAKARMDFLERVGDVRNRLEEASVYLDVAPELFGARGRRTYLVAIGNNAEMNSNGMVLAYGILDVTGGALSWSHFGSVTELQLSEPVPVPLEPGFHARWSWANPTFAWQRTNVSVDTEASGSSMAAMYRAKTGRTVDGVVYMDGVAVGYLLSATGPLDFENPNVRLDASNFADYTMNKAYFYFGNQAQRKEFLVEAAAKAIGASFNIRGSAAEKLARSIAKATAERRLWMWVADTAVEKKLIKVSLGGRILTNAEQSRVGDQQGISEARSSDVASYSLINLGGNKVDYYVNNSISHRLEIDSGGRARATVSFTIENRAPVDLPEYVGGATGPGQAQREKGEYLGYLTWYAPFGSELLDSGEFRVQSDLPDGGMAAFSWLVKVPPGSKETLTFTYKLPDNHLFIDAAGRMTYSLEYVPQPRIRADQFSSEVVLEGKGSLEPTSGYSEASKGRLYYSNSPPSRIHLEAAVRFSG
ncbi:MAG: hypothetical protein C4319_04370 [Acidimicrobiia bacterium]